MLAALILAGPAAGQPSVAGLIPPLQSTDSRGVDLVSGQARIQIPLVSFDNQATGLSASLAITQPRNTLGPGMPDFLNMVGRVISESLMPQAELRPGPNSLVNVIYPGASGYYTLQTSYEHTNPDGSRYKKSLGATHFTQILSANPSQAGIYNAEGDRATLGSSLLGLLPIDNIALANGEVWSFHRDSLLVQGPSVGTYQEVSRLRFVVSTRGYAIQFLYVSDTPPTTAATAGSWLAPRRVTSYNKAHVYCNEVLRLECPAVTALNTSTDISYNGTTGVVSITESGASDGIELTFTKGAGNLWLGDISSVRHTAVSGSTRSYQYATSYTQMLNEVRSVSRITDPDGIWNYTYSRDESGEGDLPLSFASSTNPQGGTVNVHGDLVFGQPTFISDELNRMTWIGLYDITGRVGTITAPLTNYTGIDLDDRNNVTAIGRNPVPTSPETQIIAYSAQYPVHCENPRTCNRPLWTEDGNHNRTDYTYDSVHGGLLSETGPAVNGVRPQTRHIYTQRHAWILNSAGAHVQAATPIWIRTSTSACRTSAATGNPAAPCATAGDEVLTTFDFGPNSGPNNLLLRGVAITSTDGGVSTTLRTCYGYNVSGRRISEAQPNANLGSCS